MATTAYFRALAQDLEARLEWARAADAWDDAIRVYPPHSALGKLDLSRMAERRDWCQQAAIRTSVTA